MKLKEVLDKTTKFFKEKNIETARLDAELLLAYGLGLERIQLYLKYDQPVEEKELNSLRELVRRRGQGEPVAYILGYRDFFKSRFFVNSHVLVPRPETELVVEEVLSWAKNQGGSVGIIDLGCGTGCIGLSIIRELPDAKLVAVDISNDAIEVAKENAKRLNLSERALFLNRDASEADQVYSEYKKFIDRPLVDVLVSNPPYISRDDRSVQESVTKFEPHLALFAGESGLSLLRKWSQMYSGFLAEQGIMMMEMGHLQGESMKSHFQKLEKFKNVKLIKDLSGDDRFIFGEV